MQTSLTVLAVAAVLYAGLVAGLYAFQRSLIYYPDTQRESPAEAGLDGVEETTLRTPDGETLIAWWVHADPGQPTLLYFHGNAGGLADRRERIERFASAGWGVFMAAYRGYSGSTGKPSEKAIVADALLAYDHLREAGIPARHIVPYGESLGTGVAVQLAAERPVGALVLDAPYTSLPDVGKTIYPFIPVETLTIDRFESKHYIGKVKAPILIMHGAKDATVPIGFGKALFQVAPEPKTMEVFEEAGHSDIYMFGAMDRLKRFIRANVH